VTGVPVAPTPALSRKGRGSVVFSSVEGYPRLRGRIPAKRGPCSALQRALSRKGRGSVVFSSVEGYARLRGRIPAKRGPCSALQRALSRKGRGRSFSCLAPGTTPSPCPLQGEIYAFDPAPFISRTSTHAIQASSTTPMARLAHKTQVL
jgi:hypothetical protein